MFRASLEKTYQKIKNVEIQGATSVAEATLLELKKYALAVPAKNQEEWLDKINKAAERLRSARPTEALADNAVQYVLWSEELKNAQSVPQLRNRLEAVVVDFLCLIKQAREEIVAFGQEVIAGKKKIFLHCHSGTVVDILIAGKKAGLDFEVFNTETRPLFQGRITAERLLKAGIPVTMVTDSSAGFFLSHESGQEYEMDLFLIGADAILADGSVINKIGSYGMSLAAREASIPFYSAASLLKYHPSSEIEIEYRKPEEIWANPPKGIKLINYAFDRVPPSLLSGYITEKGVIEPKDLQKKMFQHYGERWLTN
jgi:ribose 1,5-bisphosphate isomerase